MLIDVTEHSAGFSQLASAIGIGLGSVHCVRMKINNTLIKETWVASWWSLS